MVDALIDLEDASFGYDGRAVVRGLTLRVQPGEIVAIVGPNGAGKSTLLDGILRLVPLLTGRMRVAAHVGYLPQSHRFDPDFPISLRQVVLQGRYRMIPWYRWPNGADRTAVSNALRDVGLSEHATTRFGALSGGQRRRGLLARALAGDPGALLLDEPFNGLDSPNRNALVDILRSCARRNIAALVCTHDLELARSVCHKTLLLSRHHIAYGDTSDVLTAENVRRCFSGADVELAGHTLVIREHEDS